MKTILSIIAVISLFLMIGEAETPTMQILWSCGWAGVFALCGHLLEKYYIDEEEEQV